MARANSGYLRVGANAGGGGASLKFPAATNDFIKPQIAILWRGPTWGGGAKLAFLREKMGYSKPIKPHQTQGNRVLLLQGY